MAISCSCLRPMLPPLALLDMHRAKSLLVFVLCRQQAGISQLTFRKCHKEGEKRRHPLGTSVKISQQPREKLSLNGLSG